MKMSLSRCTLVLCCAVLPLTGAHAQAYPTKPIRVLVPFSPGGTSDIIGRTLGQKLSEAWGQPVIMDNRAGVAGSLGAGIAAKSPADGYTLLVGNVGPIAVNNQIYKAVEYDSIRDFTPITLAVTAPQIVVVHPSVPAKTFKELNALVKKHSGKINYGSSGPGSISMLSAELYKRMTKTDMLHVPFKASALITIALMAGEIDVVFSDMAVVLPHVKAGRLRALAVTGPKPTPLVPDLPTVSESGVPGFVMTSWWGIFGPAGLPQPIVTRLNTELVRILKLPEIQKTFATLGVDAANSTPEELAALVKSEVPRYAKLIAEIGIPKQ
ncbi:MAG: tripartite tricarboxylate transporter substrate binding protein [Betaproteobacteria bacterium]|nr:tripartite tricarboxylate transporter substrate binding protein [Betaproteobacteria bacterium]